MKRKASPSWVLLVALALGVAVDLLFHGHALGISFPLFIMLLLAALLTLGRREGVQPAWHNLWLLAPLLFLAAMVAVRANFFLTFLNVMASLALVGLVLHFYAGGRLERLGLLGYPWVGLCAGANALFQAAPLLGASLAQRGARAPGGRGPWPVVRGLLLALPVVAIFAGLLASADLVFARYVTDLLRLRFWQEALERGVIVLGAAWLLAGGLAYSLRRSANGEGTADRALKGLANALRPGAAAEGEDGLNSLLAALARVFSLGLVEAAVVLGSVNALFFTFGWIQLTYLFGGRANIAAFGYTYAEYARRGFFELVTVAVLTLALILGLHWLARRETPAQRRLFNSLGSLMIALVLVMLASAFMRLRLYELAYGFTEIRLYVYVFMVWLALTLAWFLVTLWRLPGRFAVGVLVASLGFLVTLNLINPDAFITRQNLAHYRATGKLDVAYLRTLSVDATPALLEAIGQVTGEEERLLLSHLQRVRQIEGRRGQGWPALHLARLQAQRLLLAEGSLP